MSDDPARRDPLSDAAASLLLPGLGQYLQRRRAAALYVVFELLAVLAAAALAPRLRGLAWVALAAVTLWSALDAARVAGRPRAPAV